MIVVDDRLETVVVSADREPRQGLVRRMLIGIAVISAGIGVLVAALVVLPGWLAPRDAFDHAADAVRAQNDARSVVLQGVGGLIVVLGAYVTWRQLQINRVALQHNLRTTAVQLEVLQGQLVTSRESQVTERFTQAIDQLGSDQLVVRMGGVFALARIAKDSPADTAAAEVLSAYARLHNTGPWEREPAPAHLQLRAADVQSALTILAKGVLLPDGGERLRLLGVDLRRANLISARLAGADLEGTNLAWAWAPGARLEGADLTVANLRDAHLADSCLDGAELTGANLERASLTGASLSGAILEGAHLSGATADEMTVWPDGFDSDQAGVVYIDRG